MSHEANQKYSFITVFVVNDVWSDVGVVTNSTTGSISAGFSVGNFEYLLRPGLGQYKLLLRAEDDMELPIHILQILEAGSQKQRRCRRH